MKVYELIEQLRAFPADVDVKILTVDIDAQMNHEDPITEVFGGADDDGDIQAVFIL